MASFDRKVKRAQTKTKRKAEKKLDKWEDLIPMCHECQYAYFELFSRLVETEKQFKDVIENNIKLKQAISGLSKTFSDLGERLAQVVERHTYDTGKVDSEGKPIKDFLKGVINTDDPALMDYDGISNAYNEIMVYIGTQGIELLTALFSELQAFSNKLTKDDVEMLKNAVSKGQDKIYKTVMEGVSNLGSTEQQ